MYALRYREELKDPAVVKEFDDFIAFLQHYLGVSMNEDGTLKLSTSSGGSSSVGATSITQNIEDQEGHWWRKGPWIFDTATTHDAILLTPNLGGTINDMAPRGIDTAFGVEFNLSSNLTINGIKAPLGGYRRILVLRNNSSTYTITLKNANTGSQPVNRFALPNATDIVMGTKQTVWLYYDGNNQNWGCFITGNNSGGLYGSGSTLATGDVVGPAGATDTHLAMFSGATGKLIADSGLTYAQVSGLIASAPSSGTLTVSDTQIKALNTSSQILIPGVPGKIIVPMVWTIQKGPWTNGYSANPSCRIRYATIATDLCSSIAPGIGGTGFFFGNGPNSSPSISSSPVGKDVMIDSTADVTNVGSTVGNNLLVSVSYYVV